MDSGLEKAEVSQTDDALRNTNGPNEAELNFNDPQKLSGDDAGNLRLDKHGLPLIPQPTQHKDDPLVSAAFNRTLDHDFDFYRTGRQRSNYLSLSKSVG
jgi:hypothetical protein